jgi:hypothetical protein
MILSIKKLIILVFLFSYSSLSYSQPLMSCDDLTKKYGEALDSIENFKLDPLDPAEKNYKELKKEAWSRDINEKLFKFSTLTLNNLWNHNSWKDTEDELNKQIEIYLTKSQEIIDLEKNLKPSDPLVENIQTIKKNMEELRKNRSDCQNKNEITRFKSMEECLKNLADNTYNTNNTLNSQITIMKNINVEKSEKVKSFLNSFTFDEIKLREGIRQSQNSLEEIKFYADIYEQKLKTLNTHIEIARLKGEENVLKSLEEKKVEMDKMKNFYDSQLKSSHLITNVDDQDPEKLKEQKNKIETFEKGLKEFLPDDLKKSNLNKIFTSNNPYCINYMINFSEGRPVAEGGGNFADKCVSTIRFDKAPNLKETFVNFLKELPKNKSVALKTLTDSYKNELIPILQSQLNPLFQEYDCHKEYHKVEVDFQFQFNCLAENTIKLNPNIPANKKDFEDGKNKLNEKLAEILKNPNFKELEKKRNMLLSYIQVRKCPLVPLIMAEATDLPGFCTQNPKNGILEELNAAKEKIFNSLNVSIPPTGITLNEVYQNFESDIKKMHVTPEEKLSEEARKESNEKYKKKVEEDSSSSGYVAMGVFSSFYPISQMAGEFLRINSEINYATAWGSWYQQGLIQPQTFGVGNSSFRY